MIEFSQLNLNTPLQPIKESLFKKKKKYCFLHTGVLLVIIGFNKAYDIRLRFFNDV
tara:strand:- start:539 stop:706 length:168 start_codon:yes stop_codon:yes gene_type:complete